MEGFLELWSTNQDNHWSVLCIGESRGPPLCGRRHDDWRHGLERLRQDNARSVYDPDHTEALADIYPLVAQIHTSNLVAHAAKVSRSGREAGS
jgi:hypothetical protein